MRDFFLISPTSSWIIQYVWRLIVEATAAVIRLSEFTDYDQYPAGLSDATESEKPAA